LSRASANRRGIAQDVELSTSVTRRTSRARELSGGNGDGVVNSDRASAIARDSPQVILSVGRVEGINGLSQVDEESIGDGVLAREGELSVDGIVHGDVEDRGVGELGIQ